LLPRRSAEEITNYCGRVKPRGGGTAALRGLPGAAEQQKQYGIDDSG